MTIRPKIKITPLSRWMLEHGVRGQELARRIGVDPSVISRAKKGYLSAEVREKIMRETGLKRL